MAGAAEDKAPFRDKFNTWVQTTALVLAGVWAVYTFVYQEIVVPGNSPAFISADVEISRVGSSDSLDAIQLSFTVNNQGERAIFTLPSVATVWGSRLSPVEPSESSFIDSVNSVVEADPYRSRNLLRHGSVSPAELVGFFRIFSGYEFLPKSTASNEILIYIPRGRYDQIEVDVAFPTVADTVGIDARWGMQKDGARLSLFRVSGGKRTALADSSRTAKKFLDSKDYGLIDSYSVFSLWRKPEYPATSRPSCPTKADPAVALEVRCCMTR